MSLSDPVGKAILVIIALLTFHIFPAFLMHLKVKIMKMNIIRPIWKTYLIWLIIIPVLEGPLLLGYIPFLILCYILSIMVFQELLQYTEIQSLSQFKNAIRFAITIVYVALFFGNHFYYLFSCVLGFFIIVVFSLFASDYKGYIKRVSVSLYLYIFSTVFLSHLVLLNQIDKGMIYVFIYLTLIVSNDGFCYILGFFFGKHKMKYLPSPNKTVEGTVGGIIAVSIIGFILVNVFDLKITVQSYVVIVLLTSVGGTLGDLAMSALKRDVSIKDFSTIIPGHGGLVDRMDSILLIAPIYCYFIFIINKF